MGKARRNNNEKKSTKTREWKKQKTKHNDIEEHSNSTNNLNNQSQSLECPASPRKPFIVDSMKIDSSSRRASLRSSKTKNFIEPGKTDKKPKSREHLSSTHAIHQVDDLAHQVPQSSRVEFPSRYLKPVKPNLRYREIEKGGKCFAEEITDEDFLGDLIAKMGEENVGEKEVPLAEKLVDADNEADQVPQISQVGSPSRYLKQGEPSLGHDDEIGKDGNFAAEENLGDGIAVPLPEMMDEAGEMEAPLEEKPISMATSYSHILTEFVNNMAVDKDNEIDSQRCTMDTVEGYQR